jgi:hypothetical protein
METESRHSWRKGEPAMTPSIRIRFFVVAALATSTQSAFAGGKLMGGGGGNFSRPAFKPPVVVNRSLPTHNLQTVSPSYVVKSGNYNGVVRSNVLPSGGTTNNNVQALCHHHDSDNSNVVPANPTQGTQDSNRVPRNSDQVPRHLTNKIPKPDVTLPPDSIHAPIVPHPNRPETPETQHSIGSGHPVSEVTDGTEQHILERRHLGENDVVSATNPNPRRQLHDDVQLNPGPPVFNAPTRIQVDPNLFRNIRPNLGSIGSQPGGGSSTHNTITVPPGANKHINPLPGEHPIAVRPPAPGIRVPVNGPVGSGSSNIGIFLGQISSLLPGSGDSGAVAGGVEEVVPTDGSSPAASPVSAAPVAAPATQTQAKDVLDVELTEVRLVDAGSLERNVGPRFRLYYRNAGSIEAPKFHVSVAVDLGEKVTEKAELVTVDAVGVKPGKSQSVDVRLPVEVLKMAIDYEGRPTAFNAFVALIDSDNDLDESNEKNNLLVISRAKILPVD